MKLFIVFCIVALLGFWLLALTHELVHVAIFKYVGVESDIYYEYGFPSYVRGRNYTVDQFQEAMPSHAMNEVIGYQLAPIYLLFTAAFIIIIALLEVIWQALRSTVRIG